MERQATKQPIGVLAALSSGFDTVTRQLWLLALPAGLDVLLWWGPRLKAPELWRLFAFDAPAGLDAQARLVAQQFQALLRQTFDSFNWLSWLRPPFFGVPGLTSGFEVNDVTMTGSPVWQVSDPLSLVVFVLLLTAIGVGLGGLYWSLIARQARDGRIDWAATLGRLPVIARRMLGLALLMIGLLLLLWLPTAMLNLMFGSALDVMNVLMSIVAVSLLTWLLFYLSFSVHGIVLYNQRVLEAVRASIWLGRTHFWSVLGMLAAFVGIDFGMRVLWRLAPVDSWLWLLAIGGNAFVVAGLSTATIIFYMDRVPIPGSALAPRQT